MNSLIEKRDARTKKRKEAKKMYDELIDLSLVTENDFITLAARENGDKVRLLDEGAIVYADGSLDIYIMRGTIEKFMNGENVNLPNISDDHVGTINIGHRDFATFPDALVGEWTKKDLTVVDSGDKRKSLDVNLNLFEDHPSLQAIKSHGYSVGVSVEMRIHINEDLTEKEGAWIVDEIYISDFAIVGECGNVGSSNTVSLKGGTMEKDKINLEVETEEIDENIEDTSIEETEEDNTAEESIDDDVIGGEETEGEETTDEESDDDEAEGDETIEKAMALIEEMQKALEEKDSAIKELQADIESLKKSNKKKSKKLKVQNEKIDQFAGKFKNLSVDLGLVDDESDNSEGEDTVEERYPGGDIYGG